MLRKDDKQVKMFLKCRSKQKHETGMSWRKKDTLKTGKNKLVSLEVSALKAVWEANRA